jgi:hypothetical protein
MLRCDIAYVENARPVSREPGGLRFKAEEKREARGGIMSRRRQPKTAQEKILAVIAWARRAGFYNVAGELQDALLLLPGKNERRS